MIIRDVDLQITNDGKFQIHLRNKDIIDLKKRECGSISWFVNYKDNNAATLNKVYLVESK